MTWEGNLISEIQKNCPGELELPSIKLLVNSRVNVTVKTRRYRNDPLGKMTLFRAWIGTLRTLSLDEGTFGITYIIDPNGRLPLDMWTKPQEGDRITVDNVCDNPGTLNTLAKDFLARRIKKKARSDQIDVNQSHGPAEPPYSIFAGTSFLGQTSGTKPTAPTTPWPGSQHQTGVVPSIGKKKTKWFDTWRSKENVTNRTERAASDRANDRAAAEVSSSRGKSKSKMRAEVAGVDGRTRSERAQAVPLKIAHDDSDSDGGSYKINKKSNSKKSTYRKTLRKKTTRRKTLRKKNNRKSK